MRESTVARRYPGETMGRGRRAGELTTYGDSVVPWVPVSRNWYAWPPVQTVPPAERNGARMEPGQLSPARRFAVVLHTLLAFPTDSRRTRRLAPVTHQLGCRARRYP